MRIPAPLLVFLVALVCRLVAWGVAEQMIAGTPGREFVIAGDAEGYWDLATDIAAGREYSVYTPPRRVLRTPGLPVAIAAPITIFGESKTAARGFLTVLAALGPVMIYGLGWRVGGRFVGIAAGMLAAVSPLAVGLSPLLLSDGLFATLLAAQLSIAGPLLGVGPTGDENRPSRCRAILLGSATAAAVLVRPAWLPAVPIVAAALLIFRPAVVDAGEERSSRRGELRWKMSGLFLLTVAIGLSPWVARNAIVTGHFVPTSLWLGPTLYDSFGPDADGGSNMTFFDAEAQQRKGLSEYEVDRWYRDRSWSEIRQNPSRAAALAIRKQQRFWAVWPRADEIPSRMVRFGVAGWSIVVGVLAVFGCWRGRPKVASLIVTVGPLLYFAALHLAFVGSMRYRMPAELPVCVLAAIGLQVLWNRRTVSKQ